MTTARKGKVARLSAELRGEVNRLIYDGKTALQIIAWLSTRGVTWITAQNISEWRKGGYQDWVRSEGQMTKIRERAEISLRMAQAAGGSLGESMVTRLAGQIDERLDALGDEGVLAMKPVLDVILNAEKLKLERRKLEQKDQEIVLSRQKFQRDTAELFIKWWEDEQVKRIVEDKGDKEVKMDRLVKVIFGERPPEPGKS